MAYNRCMSHNRPFTLNDLREARIHGKPLAMLTCYDYTTARHLDETGVPMLLVGDSASSVILGHPSTLPVSLDFMIELTSAVRRGAKRSLVMADMPFGSYQESDQQGIRNVLRMVKETNCDCVKIEAGVFSVSLIERLSDAGVAVVAHLGLRPQTVGLMGGYKYQGRTAKQADQIVRLSQTMVRAGASALLLEAVPPPVSQKVVQVTDVPVIGCGAGPACHAHVVVLQDLLGLTPHPPRFVPVLEKGSLQDMVRRFVDLVESGAYPDSSQTYEMPPEEQDKFKRNVQTI
ncbi:MAG: 3-methyl-2-oxobutanoate hydroxymethyltransferase [Phycisphaerae bacterium]|nr:MAG: 3-methyl-2-oxobutanoate hydroxymethyltransferase [Phycisphaerae bacterium]